MKHLHYLLFFTLTLLFFLMFKDSLAYLFPYHEQQQLFLCDVSYFMPFLKSGELTSYLGSFISQFFLLPNIGKLLFALLLASLYLFPTLSIKRLTQKTDPLQVGFILPLYLFIQFESLQFQPGIVVAFALIFLLFYLLTVLKPLAFKISLLPLALLTGYFLDWETLLIGTAVLSVSFFSALYLGKLATKTYRLLRFLPFACILIYGGATFIGFVKSYQMRECVLLETEMHIQNKNWQEALDRSRKYRGQTPLLSYFQNMALYQLGRMPYDLFKYNQPERGNSLFLPWLKNVSRSKQGHYLFEQLGHINEAHRWAFESMTIYGETAPALKNLIRYNIAADRPAVARRFNERLKQTLFYRAEAAQFDLQIDSALQRQKASASVQTAKNSTGDFIHLTNPAADLVALLQRDPTNQMAYEYLMSFLLLNNRLSDFATELARIRSFDYPEIPTLYQEALCLQHQLSGENGEELLFANEIDAATHTRFEEFQTLVEQKAIDQLRERYGNTYWYYYFIQHPVSH